MEVIKNNFKEIPHTLLSAFKINITSTGTLNMLTASMLPRMSESIHKILKFISMKVMQASVVQHVLSNQEIYRFGKSSFLFGLSLLPPFSLLNSMTSKFPSRLVPQSHSLYLTSTLLFSSNPAATTKNSSSHKVAPRIPTSRNSTT